MVFFIVVFFEYSCDVIVGDDCGNVSLHALEIILILWQKTVPAKNIQQFKDSAANQKWGYSFLYNFKYFNSMASVIAHLNARIQTHLNVKGNISLKFRFP